MFGQIVLSLTVLTASLILNDRKLSVNSEITPNVTLYPPRRQTTDLILSEVTEINIFLLMTQRAEIPVSFEVVKPALQLGIERVRRIYPHLRFNLIARKDKNACIANVAGALVAEEFYLRKVSVIIGPACSLALDPVARMASYWNLPIFTAGGIGIEFSRKNTYTSLTRMAFSLDRVSHFMVKIIREYDWHHISLIVDETDLTHNLIKTSLQTVFKEEDFGHEINLDIQSFSRKDNQTVNYQKLLKQASRSARVFIILSTGEVVRHVLLEAHEIGMGNGDYAFLGVELIKSSQSNGDFSWYQPGDKRNKQAREIYEALMMVTVRVPISPEYTTFAHKVTQLANDEFGLKTVLEEKPKHLTIANDFQVNPLVAAFHDCIIMYAWAYNKTLAVGGDPLDGRSLVRRLWSNEFKDGLTGDISINENGDREADYALNDLDPETGIMRPIVNYFGARRTFEKIQGVEVHWPASRKDAPVDVPYCGFTGDAPHCLIKEPFPVWATIMIVFFCFSVVGLVITFFVSKKLKYESSLADNWWRVNYEDIIFAENIRKSGQKSVISVTTSENDGFVSGKASTNKAPSVVNSLISAAGLESVLVGIYKGIKVAVKPLNIKKINLSRNLLQELKMIRELTHENLVRFVGLCPEEQNTAVLTELCIRGSLLDLLENEKINIDWTFRYSMMTDIVEAMIFLHNSAIQYHGRLKSTNCVVDGRFMVKVTDYGLRSLHEQIFQEQDTNPRAMFWTAPEHLRSRDPLNSGSQKGDVYAFAIILQEIITRCGPFESLERLGRKRITYEPNEILDRIRMGTVPPFRPEVAPDECSKPLLNLMHECWSEQPLSRPDFAQIKPKLRKITQGISSRNFLDNLLNRMEQYSENLERIVAEKTESVVEEKRKTDELLYQLLPKFVAEELKKGIHIQPESFDSVTIFFSDIVGFTSLSAESTPMQVVDLLNDLYSTFDEIIDIYDVYKVETIGDAYMVASGLPIRNGCEHAREIGRLAMDLRKAVNVFKIRHLPRRRLQLRIGIHSGSCVAGVVGLKMPKYCLFGDTVNTASRMETNGEPLKIHISQQTKNILDSFGTFLIVPRGEMEIKGKGLMTTYWLESENRDLVHSNGLGKQVNEITEGIPTIHMN